MTDESFAVNMARFRSGGWGYGSILSPWAVLSALILPALVVSAEPHHINLLRREMMVAIPTFLFVLKTRSMGGAVLVGMALYRLAGKIMS